MKLEVKYLLATQSSGAKFCIYSLPEGLGIRKILAHDISRQQKLIFTDFHGVIRVQIPTCTSARKFHQWRC